MSDYENMFEAFASGDDCKKGPHPGPHPGPQPIPPIPPMPGGGGNRWIIWIILLLIFWRGGFGNCGGGYQNTAVSNTGGCCNNNCCGCNTCCDCNSCCGCDCTCKEYCNCCGGVRKGRKGRRCRNYIVETCDCCNNTPVTTNYANSGYGSFGYGSTGFGNCGFGGNWLCALIILVVIFLIRREPVMPHPVYK